MPAPPMDAPKPEFRLRAALYWVGVWLLIALAIIAVGALVGSLLWALLGVPLGSELDLAGRLGYGASVGWRYARVWAGGIAFVACFMKAHEKFSLRAWWRSRRR